ncbi:MAG: hypothetical protein V1838_05085 [Patescibacteria group bacterium]
MKIPLIIIITAICLGGAVWAVLYFGYFDPGITNDSDNGTNSTVNVNENNVNSNSNLNSGISINSNTNTNSDVDTNCITTGCSSQVCSDTEEFTTCEYLPIYGCYAEATCERQADGNCGWTMTEELQACLKAPPPL